MPRFPAPVHRNRIREYRELLGMTQQSLADAAGIPRTTLSRLDANPMAKPSLEIAIRLAKALNVELVELVSAY